ncbi:amino acid synthesis family protein [Candidimonas nitroreducens]|uniref:Peptide synthetase n=1 Tax=Candidimonas nitroreducens TaxID=683354 RepID=A0A225MB43_9BURK|nr:amino acid synthesis family protein [Candidimonas nitroreducens]OWT58448.1 peptide synthetase [Candidimonas nitroreducens]
MHIEIKKWFVQVESSPATENDGGADLHKVAIAAIVKNPFGCGAQQDLSAGIRASADVGAEMAERLARYMDPASVQSYGKAGLVGVAGEQEHANALLTTTFATPLRDALHGALAWIPSVTKVGGPACSIDVPLAHKNALYVRSHYDAMTVNLADAPRPDEIVLIFAVANRGRISARVGGLRAEDVVGADGLH